MKNSNPGNTVQDDTDLREVHVPLVFPAGAVKIGYHTQEGTQTLQGDWKKK